MKENIVFNDPNIRDITNYKVNDLKYLKSKLKLPLNHLRRYNNWYLIDDVLYYFKVPVDDYCFLAELVGEELAHYFNLPTVHYELSMVKSNGKFNIGVLSSNFRLPGKIYKDEDYFMEDCKYKYYLDLEQISSKIVDIKERIRFCEEIKRLMVDDFFSMQTDRSGQNIFFELNKKYTSIKLAPLFDYSYSFYSFYPYAQSNLFFFSLSNKDDIKNIKSDDYLMHYFNFAYSINLRKIINNACDKKNININKDLTNKFLDINKQTKDIIKSKILTK